MSLARIKSLAIGSTAAIGFALAAPSAFAAVELVTNGSFETISGTAPTTTNNVNIFNKITGWTTCQYVACGSSGQTNLTFLDAANSANTGHGQSLPNLPVYAPGPGTDPNGGNFIEADADSSYSARISQMITGLVVGKSYTLSFYQAAGQQYGYTGQTTEWWNVTFGTGTGSYNIDSTSAQATADGHLMEPPAATCPHGHGVGSGGNNTGCTGGSVPWEKVTMTFIANNTSELLGFLAMGTPTTPNEPPIAFLDGVSLVMNTPLPEPVSLTLMGTGVAGLGLVKWRRRAKRTAA